MQNNLNIELAEKGVSFKRKADQVENRGKIETKVRKPQGLRVVSQPVENDQDVAEFKKRLAKVRANNANKAKPRKPRKPLSESEKRARRNKQARKPLKAKLSIDPSKVKVAA